MKALTLYQPWASLIAEGVKTIETRPWSAPPSLIGRRFAIHAAKKDTDNTMNHPDVRPAWVALGERIGGAAPPHGAVVATARLADCVPIHQWLCDCEVSTLHATVGPTSMQPGDIVGLFDADGLGVDHSDWSPSRLDCLHERHPRQQAPYGDFDCGRWAWLLDDIAPTTERCPTCRNQFDGKMPGHYYGSNWDWVPCQTCMGVGRCEPIPAKGRQKLWEWTQ